MPLTVSMASTPQARIFGALSLELFTTGSLDIFGHESTVDLDKRIVVFDIHGLGEQLKPVSYTHLSLESDRCARKESTAQER